MRDILKGEGGHAMVYYSHGQSGTNWHRFGERTHTTHYYCHTKRVFGEKGRRERVTDGWRHSYVNICSVIVKMEKRYRDKGEQTYTHIYPEGNMKREGDDRQSEEWADRERERERAKLLFWHK